ncbi:tRNA pseudouridine(55) synthase TruB [Desulforhopalus vacuolatus]|uniref:tRNA pseudouridine(55) synthase TruB n=1 Tax=Desulforhopalus vacuolatus TaxID=40414 RepID=UPI0019666BAE|nr:tRNA pseudouridine(55) synthase TruB [Desulforhopalus vacuolatus]MBM9518710.1 tRNA pseudouridine(55) synthase TruB [Desulforhopalus vacuolatus]
MQEDAVLPAGVLCIDKPPGLTSFGAVARVRRILGIKKVGHAGTLDPFATGLLVICVGRSATRLISQFMDGEKEYLATLRLGIETETLDPEGDIVCKKSVGELSEGQIEDVLATFRGVQMQKPPIYSALKHKGKPLYWYARRGIAVEKEPRKIVISELERVGNGSCSDDRPELKIRVRCSKGTYIRVLGAEIGETLGCGAYLTALRRTSSGFFGLVKAVTGEDFEAENARELLLSRMLSVEDVVKLLH